MRNTATYTRLSILCAILFLAVLGSFLIRQQVAKSRHYAQLLSEAQWMNQHDSLFTTDSVMLRVVRHYDHWWHPDSTRMKAYYLLGCAYRDMGEAPAAIHYYNIATEQADTTAKDCDFATLFRIYGQMAVIYEQQNMPEDVLEAWVSYSKNALKAKDTLNHILGIERQGIAYYQMNDTANVFRLTKEAHQLYLCNNYIQQAARAYSPVIYIHLKNGHYKEARVLMNEFRENSGLFDIQGNVLEGNQLFYEYKGLYHLGLHHADSAEYFYRKLINSPYKYEAYRGLLSVYSLNKNTDSIVKYSKLTDNALLLWATQRQADAVIQSSAMYKYERHRNKAELEAKDAQISHQIIMLLVAFLIVVCLVAYLCYEHIRKSQLQQEIEFRKLLEEHTNKENEYHRQRIALAEMEHKYEKLQEQISNTNSNNIELQGTLREMQMKITDQRKLINSYRHEVMEKEEEIMKEPIVCQFKTMANKTIDSNIPRTRDWDRLISIYKRYFPHIYAHMKISELSTQEMHSAILTHLGATTTDLVILLNTSKNTISNAKSGANQKLFGQKGAPELAANLKKCAYFE